MVHICILQTLKISQNFLLAPCPCNGYKVVFRNSMWNVFPDMVVGLPLGKTFRVTAKEKKTLIKDLGYQQPGNRKKEEEGFFSGKCGILASFSSSFWQFQLYEVSKAHKVWKVMFGRYPKGYETCQKNL